MLIATMAAQLAIETGRPIDEALDVLQVFRMNPPFREHFREKRGSEDHVEPTPYHAAAILIGLFIGCPQRSLPETAEHLLSLPIAGPSPCSVTGADRFGPALETIIGVPDITTRIASVAIAVEGGWAEYRTDIAGQGAVFGAVDQGVAVRRFVEIDGSVVRAAAQAIGPP